MDRGVRNNGQPQVEPPRIQKLLVLFMHKEKKQSYGEKWLPRPRASIPQTSTEIHNDNPFSVP